MFIIVLGATCFDSYRIIFRPFYDTDLYLAMFKTRCGIPNAYILDITMYKMHVSFCSYCKSGYNIQYIQYIIYNKNKTTHAFYT